MATRTLSAISGRAYEFACLQVFYRKIQEFGPVKIEKTDGYTAAEKAWNSIEKQAQELLEKSALAAVEIIFELEPLITEDGNDELILKIQQDCKGVTGDVRDILIVRRNIEWEIGLSLKHNHFAVKHSRLGSSLDFGRKWYGLPCSQQYWDDIKPIFDYLKAEKSKKLKWKELSAKENDVCIPLLNVFINEVTRSSKEDSSVPRKIVEYLLGKFDFYKIVSIDDKRKMLIQTFNLHGTLNQASRTKLSNQEVPLAY